MRKVKCSNPECKHEWMEDVEKIYEDGDTFILRHALASTPKFSKKKKCIDLVCPNCKNEFEYCWEE